MWVVTPQKAYAETTMYELEVTALPLYKVVVDIIDYNALTNIERVSKLWCLTCALLVIVGTSHPFAHLSSADVLSNS